MTESDLVAALRPVVDALTALGVRYYLGGSVASSAHGIARASLDADLVAELEPENIDALVSHLDSRYYIPVARAIFDGVQNGEEDIFPDPMSESMAESWRSGAAKALERQKAALLQAASDAA